MLTTKAIQRETLNLLKPGSENCCIWRIQIYILLIKLFYRIPSHFFLVQVYAYQIKINILSEKNLLVSLIYHINFLNFALILVISISWVLLFYYSSLQAYECVGKCHFPVNERLSPSKHAIIQSRLHLTMPKEYPRESCCVPTKLDSISILYYDEYGVLTYKPKYDGMVVTECGCR